MFEAWILICLAPQMEQCFPAQDTYGPYMTVEECVVRVKEMEQQVIYNVPMHIPVAYKCDKGEGV